MSDFAKKPKAETIKLNSFLMWVTKKIVRRGENKDLFKKIKSIEVTDLEECDIDIKNDFKKKITNLDISGYEVLLKVKEEENQVFILSKSKNNEIKEMIIIDSEDPAYIKIKGNFGISDLGNIVKVHQVITK